MNKANGVSLFERARNWWGEAKSNRIFWFGLVGATAVLIADQLSKYIIVHVVKLPELKHIEVSGIFDLSYVQNRGASFGMFAGGMVSRIFLSLVVVGVVVGLIGWLGQLRRPMAAIGVSFIMGGALGNLYDRIAYGYVIDFLDFSGLHFPWVFNVADMAVNIGIAFLVLDAWQTRERPIDAPKQENTK